MKFDIRKEFESAVASADSDEDVLKGKKHNEEEVEPEQVQEEVVEQQHVEEPVAQPEPPVEVHHETEVSYVTTAEPTFISQIVSLSDIVRGFDDNTKEIAETFFDTKEQSEIISKALAQTPLTIDAFQSLLNVDRAEGVDKAFYLVDLPDDLLREIGRVLGVLNNEEIEYDQHNRFCRVLENKISEKDSLFMDSIGSFMELLNKAQPEE